MNQSFKPRNSFKPVSADWPNISEELSDQLSDEQLDEIKGGIIIVGGKPFSLFSRFDAVALNPQPLPPKQLFWQGF